MKKYPANKRIILSLFLLFFSVILFAQYSDQDRLKNDINYLASDKLLGRKAGSPGADSAAAYIAQEFKKAGLIAVGNEYFQTFGMASGITKSENNTLDINGIKFIQGKDFTPLSISSSGFTEADAVFAGYGRVKQKDTLSIDDYKGAEMKGKWVLVLAGVPGKTEPFRISSERNKATDAKDRQVQGVIFICNDDNLPLEEETRTLSPCGIPVICIKRSVGVQLLKEAGIEPDSVYKKIRHGVPFYSTALPYKIMANIEMAEKKAEITNVIGLIEGTDASLKSQYIVIGGHYDHLGLGGPGSGSREPDIQSVHYGADDNASGVSAVMEMARVFKQKGIQTKRSIVFVAFTAEELGLIGSKYFLDHPPVPVKNINAFINFDMIGRLNNKENGLIISGSGTSTASEKIIKDLKSKNLNIKLNPDGFGPSDHASFYTQNIPVFFFTTGAHDDYHTSRDKVTKINFKGMTNIVDYAFQLLILIADRDSMLVFRESGPKKEENTQMNLKVTLGILPDVTGTSHEGLRVDGVRKDGPAERGGIKKGDVIIQMNGKPVKDIYEYMHRLNQLEPGQTVNVDVMRNGKKIILLIQL